MFKPGDKELEYKPGYYLGDITERSKVSDVLFKILEDQSIGAKKYGYDVSNTEFVFAEQLEDSPYKAKGYINGFSDLKTREEFELYKCSKCGKEGHNRRTCPEIFFIGKAEYKSEST